MAPSVFSVLPHVLKLLSSSAQSFSFLCDKHHSPFHLAKPQTWQKRTFNCLIYPQPNPGCRTGRPPPVQRLPLRPLESSVLQRLLEENRTSSQGFKGQGCSMPLSSLLGTLQMCCIDRRDFTMGFPTSSWAFLPANILRAQHSKCHFVLKLSCYKITVTMVDLVKLALDAA